MSDNTKHRRLQELDHSDFEIVKDEPDIRGWDVRTTEGKKIGEVEELIVDAQQKKVRYMVVELDDDDLDLEDDKKVLIPIGLAELHKEDDDVLLPSVTVEQLRTLPGYDRDSLDDETERAVCTTLGRGGNDSVARRQASASPGRTESVTDNTTIAGSRTTPSESNDARTENSTSGSSTSQPALGSAEFYGNFYQHAYFSDHNLYKNRKQEEKTSQQNQESEFERSLRLWEQRSEGGIISGSAGTENSTTGEHTGKDLSSEKRKEMIENRRKQYEDRRGSSKDNTIIQRIKDEGLRDA